MMLGKKEGVIFLGLFLMIFLLGLVSPQNCSIVDRVSCTDNIVMGISSLSNTHVELASEGNYNYVLCCDFGTGNTVCDANSSNKIIGLSSPTNAHAEIPEGTTYTTDEVCYENLECVSNVSVCPVGYDIEMFSLTSSTNAHVGEFSNYSMKVCCKEDGPGPPGVLPQGAYWANVNDPRFVINSIVVVPGITQVALILTNAGAPLSTLNYEVYEADEFTSDDPIRTGGGIITGSIDDEGTGLGYWTITDEDLSKTYDFEQFYFNVNTEQSGDLEIILSSDSCVGINYCTDYTTQNMCEPDTCAVAEASVNRLNSEITCGDGYICECVWDGSSCASQWTEFNRTLEESDPGNALPGLGTCNYIEDTNDDCTDGFLTYSWQINIDWPSDNDNFLNKSDCITAGGDDFSCVEFLSSIEPNFDNEWHYDPLVSGENPLLAQCQSGSNTIQCPAQMQLPFFTWVNFIITVIVLILAYIVYTSLKKENKKSKKKTKKKSKKK